MLDKEILKNVVTKILNMDYGDTITHDELAKDFNVVCNSDIYYQYIRKLKNECLECGKMLENIMKIGYRITSPDDYSNRAITQYKHAARRMKKGEKILQYAPTQNMSKEGLTEYRRVNDRIRLLNAHMSGAIVELKLLNDKKQHPYSNSTQ